MICKIINSIDNIEALHKKSQDIDISNKEELNMAKLVIKDLIDTANDNQIPAVGLAAIQIDLPYRIFIFKYKGEWREIINPVIVHHSKARIAIKEECLSVPETTVRVLRYKKIIADGYDKNGDKIGFKLNDLDSIVFQHELDHLNGKLICDYIPV